MMLSRVAAFVRRIIPVKHLPCVEARGRPMTSSSLVIGYDGQQGGVLRLVLLTLDR
jgi:hypothetical protein